MKTKHCVACLATDNLQHHHLIPRSRGGSDDETNLITLCEACHAKAHGRPAVAHRKLTIEGLGRAKARGVKLGCPKHIEGNKVAVARLREKADAFAEQMRQHIEPVRGQSLRKIAAHLQAAGIRTRTGGEAWNASQVSNLLRRLYP